MFHGYTRFISKYRWFVIAAWLLLTVASVLGLPNLSHVVAHENTTFLPTSSSVVQTQQLVNQVDPQHQSKSSAVVSIHNQAGLTSADKQYFEGVLEQINNQPSTYHASSVQYAGNTDKSVASAFLSKDGTTEIGLVGLPTAVEDQATSTALSDLRHAFQDSPQDAHVYFTGDAPIQQDDIQISQSGAAKTGIVTVVLVLFILLLVFRSFIAPFVTLLSIGLSFMISSGVVAWFAQRGLPVSTFTQTFLIAVLFGAGTDYSIILLNRFREEMTNHHLDRVKSLEASLHALGKTVMFSGLTVFVSFAVLYFANFGLYRSAVGVAIGIAITLVMCLTFIPALMSILGEHLYWPRKPVGGTAHKPSRIWSWTAGVATRRPWWSLAALVVVLLPVAMLFTNDRTFDPMEDIPTSQAVKGFQVVSDAFGPGQVMPLQIVLKSPDNLRTSQGLTTIENMSKSMAGVHAVKQVESATRPIGSVISEFQLANQNGKAADGLAQVNQGLSTLSSELNPRATVTPFATGLQHLQSGAGTLSASTNQFANSLAATHQGTQQLLTGLQQASTGTSSVTSGANQLSKSTEDLSRLSSNLANAIATWSAAHPDATADPQWQQIESMVLAQQNGTAQAFAASQQLAQGAQQLAASMPGLVQGSNSLDTGAAQLSDGAHQLATGATKLQQGAAALHQGSGQLTQGVQGASQGAEKLGQGVTQVQQFLTQTSQMNQEGDPGFYVPPSEVSANADLGRAMDAYISPDGHIAKFSVILDTTPYSKDAIQDVPSVQQAAQSALAISPIHTGDVSSTGTSATQAELNRVSNDDFTRTMSIILVAIFILLMLMMRSIITPLYIIVSLAATYFVTMGILQELAIHVFHHPGVSWAVPFFVFLLLVALGVDYSIFLMSRFDEEYRSGVSASEAMKRAMGNMGNVIFSAALIMAGTFGSMTVSGVTTMVEIGASIIIGLLLYTAVLLAFFVPASATVFGGAHRWPFPVRRVEEERVRRISTETSSIQPSS